VFAEGERPLVFSERALEMVGNNFVGLQIVGRFVARPAPHSDETRERTP